MAVRIDGYYDKNFGDDYMIKTVLEHFCDEDFIINESDGVSEMLKRTGNVRMSDEVAARVLRVIGSGFMINHIRAFVFELLWLIEKRKEPDWCIGCNIEPFRNFICEAVMRRKLNKYKLITCRDKKSYLWLKANCKNTRVEYFPDIVFAADIKKPQTRGDKLGISVMNIGFGKKYEGYYKALAEAADYFIGATGRDVYLLAFDAGRECDEDACAFVRNLMKNKNAKIIVHGSENEIVNAYSECGKIIGARFHSAVLALKMGIDLYPVIYRQKMQALLDDINFCGGRSHVQSMDIDSIKEFLQNEKFSYTLPSEYIEKATGHFDVLKEFL